MSRKKIISLGIIVLLGFAIIIPRITFNGSVPLLEPWEESADEIIVKGGDYNIRIYKEDDRWLINTQAYAADNEFIEAMLSKVKELKLLDLISEKGYTENYNLSEEKRVHVKVSSKGEVLRDLYIGKDGSTYNHVYVMVDDYPGIYLTSGLMAADFTREIDDLRDKKIIDVSRENIEAISLRYRGKTYSFYQKLAETSRESENDSSVEEERKWYCAGYGNREVASERINSMLSSFGPLKAETFPEGISEKSLKNAGSIVKIRAGGKDIQLNIFGKTKDGQVIATSSESPYVFTIGEWIAERFFIEKISEVFVK